MNVNEKKKQLRKALLQKRKLLCDSETVSYTHLDVYKRQTIDKFNSHIMGSYGRLNVVLDKGEDDKAVDENGKTYIDFGSGIGTNSLGYCNKEWADACLLYTSAVK